jgi:hypothetical protein
MAQASPTSTSPEASLERTRVRILAIWFDDTTNNVG